MYVGVLGNCVGGKKKKIGQFSVMWEFEELMPGVRKTIRWPCFRAASGFLPSGNLVASTREQASFQNLSCLFCLYHFYSILYIYIFFIIFFFVWSSIVRNVSKHMYHVDGGFKLL